MPERARFGWTSDFPTFRDTSARVVRGKLRDFIGDASPQQISAWDDAIPKLQTEVREVLEAYPDACSYTAILEYELPLDSRRPDVILLVNGAIVVLELKGKLSPSQADLDQAAAYARDLRCYHRACDGREVHGVVVPTLARGSHGVRSGVHIVGPDRLDALVQELQRPWPPALEPERFLAADAYCPLPTLVQAARELFEFGELRPIRRARAATDPAVHAITAIAQAAAMEGSRHLVLVSGVPGAGKTLVGLRVVHAHTLDSLAVERAQGKPTAPAVFLSGNGPLVEVLQYELRGAGGGGSTFVRGVKDYVKYYSGSRHRIPPEHVLIFDEAQRAWDAERVAEKHPGVPAISEPEHFIEFAERIPEWCVVVGLIGHGQEIHVGEEAGLGQWRRAVERSPSPSGWVVHGPPSLDAVFAGSDVPVLFDPSLDLDTEIRFHLATDLDRFVESILGLADSEETKALAVRLESCGYHLRITRDLGAAKEYLQDRYREHPLARFGLLMSSRDKSLSEFGVDAGPGFGARKAPLGPWYGDGEESTASCRRLSRAVTEFDAQGLELDAVLLAWGTDLMLVDGRWSTERAKRFQNPSRVKNPFQLRLNSYRVLLTRGRDGSVIFVPPLKCLDSTYEYLAAAGFSLL